MRGVFYYNLVVPVPRWFHEREQDESGPHALIYDVPLSVRVKVVPVLRALLPLSNAPYDDGKWNTLIEELRGALGVREVRPYREPRGFALRPHYLWQNFLEDAPYQEFFTAVQVTLEFSRQHAVARDIGAAVDQINGFLGADYAGFRFIETNEQPKWRVIRIDSNLTYDTTIRRPLGALSAAGFTVAEDQFVDALRKRSEGDYAGTITDANAAMESVIKRILGTEKGQGAELLQELAKAGYLPGAMANKMGAVGEVFEMLPIIRNERGSAHGRLNPSASELPQYADLALGIAGTAIGFLMAHYRAKH